MKISNKHDNKYNINDKMKVSVSEDLKIPKDLNE